MLPLEGDNLAKTMAPNRHYVQLHRLQATANAWVGRHIRASAVTVPANKSSAMRAY